MLGTGLEKGACELERCLQWGGHRKAARFIHTRREVGSGHAGSWTDTPCSPQLCGTGVGCSASACLLQLQTAGAVLRNTPSCTGTNRASAQPGQPADPAPWVLWEGSCPLGYPTSSAGLTPCPPLCVYSSEQMVQWTPKPGSGAGDGKCLPPCPPCSSAALLEHVIPFIC